MLLTSWLAVNIQLRANLGQGPGPRAQPRNLACLRKSCFLYLAEALPQPPGSAAALDRLPCAQGSWCPEDWRQRRTHCCPPGAHWLRSVLPGGHSPSAHTISCSWGCFTQLCSGQLMGSHMSPYPARRSDTLSLKNPHGFGLLHSWVQPQLRRYTRESSLWVPHSQEHSAHTPSYPGLGLGCTPAPAFSGLLRSPSPPPPRVRE